MRISVRSILISIIVPVFNVENELDKCIKSLINQTYKNIEIILVNDGSSDESGNLCDEYAKQDSRIKVIHQANKGRVNARKVAFEHSSGDYITFVDSDDWIDEDTYERVISYLNNKIDMVSYGLIEEYPEYSIIKKNKVESRFYEKEELEELYEKIICHNTFFEWKVSPALWNKIIRRDILLKSKFCEVEEEISYGEDFLINLSCYLEIENILFLDIYPYHYWQKNYMNGFETINVSTKSMKLLYSQIKGMLEESKYKKCFKRQLKFYFWFILLLRKYNKLHVENYLFPINKIKKGSNIILYGAGEFGISVYKHIIDTKIVNIAGWIDKNYNTIAKKKMNIEPIESIKYKSYDYIFITILNENVCKEILDYFVDIGIDKERIVYIKAEDIINKELPNWIR